VKRQMVITDLTRMRDPNVCIAGYDRDWTSLRPVVPFRGIPQWFLHKDGSLVIRPFAVVEFDFLRPAPEASHTEDWEIDRFHRRLVTAQLPEEKRLRILERTQSGSVAEIFEAEIHGDAGCYLNAGEGERSLGTIRPAEFLHLTYEPKDGGKWDYRIAFRDLREQTYRLSVTDLAFRCFLDHSRVEGGHQADELAADLTRLFNERTTFLRIGLARHWERFPDRCYLQITGIYSFPDYLDGRTFADFSQGGVTCTPTTS